MKKKKVPHRDLIAKEMLLSGKYKSQIIPNKKKKLTRPNQKTLKNLSECFFIFKAYCKHPQFYFELPSKILF